MMNTPRSIALTLVGFLLSIGAFVAFIYGLMMLNGHGEGQSPYATTLLIGGGVLLAIIALPIFFLKKFSRLSRHVEHDDSSFEVSRIAEHQRRPRINYL